MKVKSNETIKHIVIRFKSVCLPLLGKSLPEDVVNAVSALYNDSKRAVIGDGNISNLFEAFTGVLQGHVLAPFLFIILVDEKSYSRC